MPDPEPSRSGSRRAELALSNLPTTTISDIVEKDRNINTQTNSSEETCTELEAVSTEHLSDEDGHDKHSGEGEGGADSKRRRLDSNDDSTGKKYATTTQRYLNM